MPDILDIIVFGITALYVLLICQLYIGWITLKPFKQKTENNSSVKISVIIPARNEEQCIQDCISSILNQDYPSQLFEIIVVDDNSTDKTNQIVKDIIRNYSNCSIKLIQLADHDVTSSFKKNAITQAVKEASGDLIVTTDADCTMNHGWLSSIASFYLVNHPAFISSPVCYSEEDTFFKKIQSIEFLSLIYSGASLISLGFPVMCNGANLAFEKKVFDEVSGYDSEIKFASGDDVFLMMKIKKKYPNRIAFLKSIDAMVYTKPSQSIGSFIQQRKRWVSKSSGYKSFAPLFVALVIFLFNALIVFSSIFAIYFKGLWSTIAALLIIKFLVDLPAISGSLKFAKKTQFLWLYLPMQLIYPIYITIIGIVGNIGGYNWKGRKSH
jgi:cellulose synthase/poly-beta-1,6-N-acetylglucosamine synthase-like glycosyltransferase